MVKRMALPDAAVQQKTVVNKFFKNGDILPIEVGENLALCLLHLGAGVTPADYPAMKVAVEAIADSRYSGAAGVRAH